MCVSQEHNLTLTVYAHRICACNPDSGPNPNPNPNPNQVMHTHLVRSSHYKAGDMAQVRGGCRRSVYAV